MRNKLKNFYYLIAELPILGAFASHLSLYIFFFARRLVQILRPAINSSYSPSAHEKRAATQLPGDTHIPVRNPAYTTDSCAKFSIIINTCDRRAYLRKAIDSALSQLYPDFEVICVNSPSADDTEELLASYGDKIIIRNCPEKNLSLSRNIGLAAAGGEFAAFLDDDAMAAPDWLMELGKGFADSAVACVGGFIHDRTGIGWQSKVCVADRFGDVMQYDTVAQAVKSEGNPDQWHGDKYFSPTGTNMGFRMADIKAIGGFDENYAYHLDETDVIIRLNEVGKKIVYAPDAVVIHKLAESSARKKGGSPLSLYHIARSKAYFILRHAAPIYGYKKAKRRISAYAAWLKAKASYSFHAGEIDAGIFERLKAEIARGIEDGKRLATGGGKYSDFLVRQCNGNKAAALAR